jgi:molybdopterin molybdotransferase
MKKINLKKLKTDYGCLSEYDPNSLSFNSAQKILQQLLQQKKLKTKIVNISDALHCFIADNIRSPINVPNYNNSAMDGYVLNHKSINKKTKLLITGEILAGHPIKKKLGPSECFKIMTGGMIPNDANVVIPKELVIENSDNSISFDFLPKKLSNIRLVGEDLKKGEVAIFKNTKLNPTHIGLLASLGIKKIKVYIPLNIGFFTTGDEVISIEKKIKPGQVYDSNRYLIASMIKNMGINLTDYGNLPDKAELLEKKLKQIAKKCDLVITTGGVSVGEADYMKMILDKIGEILFWKMAIKPGRPMAFGKIDSCFYFGLPGNPVSAAVTFLQFVQPSINYLISGQFTTAPILNAKLNADFKRKAGRTEFIRGKLIQTLEGVFVTPLTQQGSGMLKSMSDANCFILLDADCELIKKGEYVQVQSFIGIF